MEPNLINENVEIQPERPGFWQSAMTYGLYFAIISIALTVLLYATDNMMSKAIQWLSIAVIIAAVVIIQLAWRKSLGGYMSYGQGLGIAVLSLVFASVIIAIFTFILYKFIDPGLIEQIKLATEEQLYQRGMPDEQINAAMAISSKFQTPAIMAVMAIINMAVMGLIFGAIAAIFTKKSSPSVFN
jgi:hypothetical protein